MSKYPHVPTGVYLDYRDGEGWFEVPASRFPYGELHVQLPPSTVTTDIDMLLIWKGPETLESFILTASAIRNAGCSVASLQLPYMCYSRQDRVTGQGTAFSMEAFAEVVKMVSPKSVHTFDLHNPTCRTLFEPLPFFDTSLVAKFLERKHTEYDYIVFPDAGAYVRYMDVTLANKVLVYKKERQDDDVAIMLDVTPENFNEHDLGDCKILVVDDLCDGGKTFTTVQDELIGVFPYDTVVDLYVTHMKRASDELTECFHTVMSSNSLWHDKTKPLTATIEWN